MEMSGEAGRLAMSTDAVAGAAIVAATVAGMKMEFPGPSPVFGHGFSPPVGGLVLDLSSSKHPSGSSLPFSAGNTHNNSHLLGNNGGSLGAVFMAASIRISMIRTDLKRDTERFTY